ncbi:MAG TPA: hypothetical protein VNX46_10750 [Candidatus Acidoferrum sp.]|jgi:hypothetical protein|nr:hypothetical protein [Candidatus Acidoferrum sp.]
MSSWLAFFTLFGLESITNIEVTKRRRDSAWHGLVSVSFFGLLLAFWRHWRVDFDLLPIPDFAPTSEAHLIFGILEHLAYRRIHLASFESTEP